MPPLKTSERVRDVALVLETGPALALRDEDRQLIRQAAALATTSLLILLPSPFPRGPFARVQRFLSEISQIASIVLAKRNEPLLPVEIVVEDLRRRKGAAELETTGYAHVLRGGSSDGQSDEDVEAQLFSTVAMGGTFDHLHAGHRVLLTMAAWVAERRVIAGITAVQDFMALIAPGLIVDTPALQDVYGPTSTDPDVQAVVVSRESIEGGRAISKERTRKGLCDVEVLVIDLIAPDVEDSSDHEAREKAKMGSTAIREWLASSAG